MQEISVVNNSEIQLWISQKLDVENLRQLLAQRGLSDESIKIHLKEFKKLRYAKRQSRGFIFASIGAFLGFVSCLLTVLNPIPELYNLILFGLTSFAIIIIFIGLYFIFE